MRRLLLILLLCPAFSLEAQAQGIYEDTAQASGIYAMEEGLDQEALDISGRLKVDGSYQVDSALDRLWERVKEAAARDLSRELGRASGLMAIALLCALASAICPERPVQDYVAIAGCCAAALSLLGGLDSIVEETVRALRQLSDYSKAAMPALYTVAAVSGAPGSSAAKYAAVSMGLDVLMSAAQGLLIPMVYGYMALAVSASVFPNSLLSGGARLVRFLSTTVMTAGTMAFALWVGMTGLISGSVDAAAIKAARTVISTTLPVVGGIASDASAALLSAAGIVRSSAGAFGLIAVAALCAGPFVSLSVRMLVLKAAAAAADLVADKRLSALISSVATAMGLLLGLLGCCSMMLFISITAGIKVVA